MQRQRCVQRVNTAHRRTRTYYAFESDPGPRLVPKYVTPCRQLRYRSNCSDKDAGQSSNQPHTFKKKEPLHPSSRNNCVILCPIATLTCSSLWPSKCLIVGLPACRRTSRQCSFVRSFSDLSVSPTYTVALHHEQMSADTTTLSLQLAISIVL